MSIITLFKRKPPTLAGLEFDAVLEDVYEGSVEYTGYTIENGAFVADHGIVQPSLWRMTGAVSNNPLSSSVAEFTIGIISNFISGNATAAIAGLSAGFLAGSDDTRASTALTTLISLMVSKVPFDIDAGDISLSNMVITNLRRVKDPSNENGLVFVADMQELPTLNTIDSLGQPNQSQLRDDDPAKNQAAGFLDRGEQQTEDYFGALDSIFS